MALDRSQQEALTRIEHTLREDDPSLARTLDTFALARRSRRRIAVTCVLLGTVPTVAVLGVRAVAVLAVVLVLAAPVAACLAVERAATSATPAPGSPPVTGRPAVARCQPPDPARRRPARSAGGNGRLRAGRPPRRRQPGRLPRSL